MKGKTLFLALMYGICTNGIQSHAESVTLQDIVSSTAPLPAATIYVAREIVTLVPNRPSANAVAVVGDRILATGSLEGLKAIAGDQPYKVDNTFADKVIVPGFIAQHDHPLLTALTMTSDILAIRVRNFSSLARRALSTRLRSLISALSS